MGAIKLVTTFLLRESTTLFSFPLICLISKSYSLRKDRHLSCLALDFVVRIDILGLYYWTLAEIFYLLSDGATFLKRGLLQPTLSHKLHSSFLDSYGIT